MKVKVLQKGWSARPQSGRTCCTHVRSLHGYGHVLVLGHARVQVMEAVVPASTAHLGNRNENEQGTKTREKSWIRPRVRDRYDLEDGGWRVTVCVVVLDLSCVYYVEDGGW